MKNLILDVDFYDQSEKNLFGKNFPEEFQLFEQNLGQISLSYEEFRTYSQFRHQNAKISCFKSYLDIEQKVNQLAGTLESYLTFDDIDNKLYSKYSDNNEINEVSEQLGVGGILAYLSNIYGLTHADWQKIDITGYKDFDFDSTSINGFSKILVTEAKGTVQTDNSLKGNASQHRTSIKEKKKDDHFKEKYKSVDLLIGGITVADPKNHLKLWLVDPPAFGVSNPNFNRKVQLLKRLIYYSNLINHISSRTYISLSLKNRIEALKAIISIEPLDGLLLINGRGQKLSLSETFVNSHSHIGRSIIGRVTLLSENRAVFMGLEDDYFAKLIEQNFDKVLSMKSVPRSFNTTINCFLPLNKASDKFTSGKYTELGKRIFFLADNVEVVCTSSGFHYGIINSSNVRR